MPLEYSIWQRVNCFPQLVQRTAFPLIEHCLNINCCSQQDPPSTERKADTLSLDSEHLPSDYITQLGVFLEFL